jgi:MFS family permease
MNKHLLQGVVCGGIFAAVITWIAASDAMTEGGLALLASVVFGLAAGLCIGGLIAANFAMLAVEEKEAKEAVAHRAAETPAAA